GYAFPPQLHVVVEAATDEVRVAVVEPRDHPPSAGVDHAGPAIGEPHDLVAGSHGLDQAVPDGDRLALGVGAIERGYPRIGDDHIGHAVLLGAPGGRAGG